MDSAENKRSLNFLEEIIEKDIKEGKHRRDKSLVNTGLYVMTKPFFEPKFTPEVQFLVLGIFYFQLINYFLT